MRSAAALTVGFPAPTPVQAFPLLAVAFPAAASAHLRSMVASAARFAAGHPGSQAAPAALQDSLLNRRTLVRRYDSRVPHRRDSPVRPSPVRTVCPIPALG